MLVGAFDKPAATAPPASLQELRRRRAVILLQKGFNKACVEDWCDLNKLSFCGVYKRSHNVYVHVFVVHAEVDWPFIQWCDSTEVILVCAMPESSSDFTQLMNLQQFTCALMQRRWRERGTACLEQYSRECGLYWSSIEGTSTHRQSDHCHEARTVRSVLIWRTLVVAACGHEHWRRWAAGRKPGRQ